MEKIIRICAVIILLSGCKSISYVQLYETAGVNSTKLDSVYTFQNDTLRIDYIFWADKGRMAFRIYNRSDKPLYIDWYKSSYISNSSRNQYWTDQTKTNINFDAVSYKYFSLFPTVTGYTGGGIATNSKPEKISFIPPRSYIDKIGYQLTNKNFSNWGNDFSQNEEPRKDNPKATTIIFSKQFTKDNSPLNFRNFLTFSFKEDFSTEFYVDNEYYIKSITAMDKRNFWDNVPDNSLQGDYRHPEPAYDNTITRFKRGTDFYLITY